MDPLAVTALVLSIIALVWNFAQAWVRWPRLSIEVNQSVEIGNPTREYLHLTVINHGSEPVTIRNIGLSRTDNAVSRNYEYDARKHPDKVPHGEMTLPARIEGHGVAVWRYDDDQLDAFQRGDTYVGWVDRYRSLPMPAWPARLPRPRWLLRLETNTQRLRITKRRAHRRRHQTATIYTKN